MKNLILKFKKSCKAFIDTWTGVAEKKEADRNVSNLKKVMLETVELLDALNEITSKQDKIFELDKIAKSQAIEYGKNADLFFDRIINHVLPPFLVEIYKGDRKPIPQMEVRINKFNDLRYMTTGQELVFVYRGRIVGHLIVTSKFNEITKQIENTYEEKYAVDKSPDVEYKLQKNPA